jgi:hypothetical protein
VSRHIKVWPKAMVSVFSLRTTRVRTPCNRRCAKPTATGFGDSGSQKRQSRRESLSVYCADFQKLPSPFVTRTTEYEAAGSAVTAYCTLIAFRDLVACGIGKFRDNVFNQEYVFLLRVVWKYSCVAPANSTSHFTLPTVALMAERALLPRTPTLYSTSITCSIARPRTIGTVTKRPE